MAVLIGCIQSQRCHTNQCPVVRHPRTPSVQGPRRAGQDRARLPPSHSVVAEAQRLLASMGLTPDSGPHHLVRRVDHVSSRSYAELFEWLAPGQLLDEPPEKWVIDWGRARTRTPSALSRR